jgi:hypothetical protein
MHSKLAVMQPEQPRWGHAQYCTGSRSWIFKAQAGPQVGVVPLLSQALTPTQTCVCCAVFSDVLEAGTETGEA